MTAQPQNKEQAILEAAEREFLAKGFEGARTTSIAAAAGVTHAMLHYYFRTKENIFDRILDEKVRLMGEMVLMAFGAPGLPILERIRTGIADHFDFLAANPDLPRFFINEVAAKPERYEAMRNRIRWVVEGLMTSTQQELDLAAERGEIERIDVRVLLLDILSLNVFSFIAYPVIEPLFCDDGVDFFEQRKAENVEVILRRLKKQTA